MFGEARCCGDEVTSARMHAALATEHIRQSVADPLERGRVVSGRDEHWDAGVTDRVELWVRLTGRPSTLRPPNAGDHVLGELAVTDGCAREVEELAQLGRVHVHPVGEDRIADAFEPRHLGIVRDEVVERRLDQGERAHAARRGGGRDQRPEGAVGVGDNVRAADEQRRQVQGVHLEVLTLLRWWTRRIATAMDICQRPPIGQRSQSAPRRPRAGTAMHKQDLGPKTITHHHDLAHAASIATHRETRRKEQHLHSTT